MKTTSTIRPLVGIGDLVADVVVKLPELPVRSGDFTLTDDFYVEAGGTANFLIMAARLKAPSIAMGTVGMDMWGQEAASILESESVDLSLVTPSGTTTRALVLVDELGQHAFVGKFGNGDIQTFSRLHAQAVRAAGGIFVSGYSFGEEHLTQLAIRAMETAGNAKVPRCFDPGPAYTGLPAHLKQQVLALTDILMMNEAEQQAVCPEGIMALFEQGISLVALKLGAGGCEIHCPDGKVIRHPGFHVPVTDTTAAGDSFAAGFLRAYSSGLSLELCAAFANSVGAAKVKKLGGGRNVPTYNEVMEVFKLDGLEDPFT